MSKLIRTVIIDDEPKAIELLENYCNRIPELFCSASFRDPIKAIEFLENRSTDIVFLDINMPKITGVQLARIAPKECLIIFTTAYSQYAVESYDLNATDYLLKPISFDRFLKAFQKAKKNIDARTPKEQLAKTKTVVLKSGYQLHQLETSEILFLEKEGNYMTYYTATNKIVTRESIGTALEKLPGFFIQAHKSYVVNTKKIQQLNGNSLSIATHEIPVSKSHLKKVKSYLNSL